MFKDERIFLCMNADYNGLNVLSADVLLPLWFLFKHSKYSFLAFHILDKQIFRKYITNAEIKFIHVDACQEQSEYARLRIPDHRLPPGHFKLHN